MGRLLGRGGGCCNRGCKEGVGGVVKKGLRGYDGSSSQPAHTPLDGRHFVAQ